MLIVVLKQGRLLNSMRQNRSLGLDPLSASLCPSPSRPTSDATDILPPPSDVKPTMAPWFAFFEVCATYNAETPQRRLTNTTGMGCCQSMPLHHTQTLPSLITPSAHPQPFLQPSRPQSIPQDQQIAGSGAQERRGQYVAAYMPRPLQHAEMVTGTGPSTFDHFKDELKLQLRELTWQKRPPK